MHKLLLTLDLCSGTLLSSLHNLEANVPKTLLARNTSRGTLALTVVFHSSIDSERERGMLLVYIEKSCYLVLCVVNMNCLLL